MLTTLIFLLVLAVLIFVHELGHFLLARWNGIRVDEFKIGFGPRLLSWGKGETKYGLNLIPFGGYVKIHGENPDEDSTSGPDKGRSFVNKKPWRQVSVLVAGVTFNFLFAWLIYIVVFTTGVTASTSGFGEYSAYFRDPRIMVTAVTPASPASVAGLKVGDVLTRIGDQKSNTLTVENVQETTDSSGGVALSFDYIREGRPGSVDIVPISGLVSGRNAIGIAMDQVADMRLPVFVAVYEGARYTLIMIKETAVGLYAFFSQLFQGQADMSQISGPIGIAGIVGGAAKMGLTYLLMITAIISINLGVINLIPFPALDGGRVLFVLIEKIIRRRLSPIYANATNTVGFVLLMILMVVVTYKDVMKML